MPLKIRTVIELIDKLDEGSSWRKQEMINYQSILNVLEKNLPLDTGKAKKEARASILVAYAHWEGFVKQAAKAYVAMACYKQRPISDLSPSFKALACRQQLSIASDAGLKIGPHLEVVKMLTNASNIAYRIDPDIVINTESNLRDKVFENICTTIGLDYGIHWSSLGPKMNDLHRTRCEIAHGEMVQPGPKDALELLRFSISSIDRFKTDIENLAATESYCAVLANY